MSKLNHKIVLFTEPTTRAWLTPSKIGTLFMNRFAIDEELNHEILITTFGIFIGDCYHLKKDWILQIIGSHMIYKAGRIP